LQRLSRATEISLLAGDGSRPRPHIHGVEERWGSKFWASGDDDASSVSSADEEFSSIDLVKEATEAGFTVDQLCQAEYELSTPSSVTPKTGNRLKEGSIAKKVIDMWVNNRRSKGQPWSGPLPPPRQSPLRALGDALANAKIEKKVRINSPHASRDRRPACPQSSSVGPR
jgi:hypothetical protein